MEIDQEKLKALGEADDEVERQFQDLKELEDDEMETVQNDDSDEEEMQRIIKESKIYDDDAEDEEMEDEQEGEDGQEEEEDEDMQDESEEEKFDESSEEEAKG